MSLSKPISKPIRSVYVPAPSTHHFIGRQSLLEQLREDIWEKGLQSVALMGPPGVGKTRLVRELGQVLANIQGWRGVWYCDLDGVRAGWEVMERIADAAGLTLSQTTQSITLPTVLGALSRYCPAVLILDSLECLDDDGVALVESLNAWEEEYLRLVMTTRDVTALRSFSERVVEVPPLSLQSTKNAPSEAVDLLLARARTVGHQGFSTAEEYACLQAIAQNLEGLPLALELAAARLAILDPEEILERLERCLELLTFPRAGATTSLRAAIDTSWELMSPDEQVALAQCAIFPDHFDAEAVEAVLILPESATSVFDALHGLVDRSLVQHIKQGNKDRYKLLASIREYGLEKLDAIGPRDAIEDRYTGHFAQRADLLRRQLEASMEAAAFEGLSAILGDLRAIIGLSPKYTPLPKRRRVMSAALAIAALLHAGNVLDVEDKLQAILKDAKATDAADAELQFARGKLLIQLWRLYRQRGQKLKRCHYLEEALAWARDHDNPHLRAWVWLREAIELWTCGDSKLAFERLQHAIAEARRGGDRVSEARAMITEAYIQRDLGKSGKAWAMVHPALQILEEAGAELAYVTESANAVGLLYQLGAVDAAVEATTTCVERLARSGGYMYLEGGLHRRAASCLIALGSFGQAREHLAACTRISEKTGRPGLLAYVRVYESFLALREGEPGRACALSEQAVHIRRKEGNRRMLMFALKNMSHVLMATGACAEAQTAIQEATDLAVELQMLSARIELLALMSLCAARSGDPRRARSWGDEAQTLARDNNEISVGLELHVSHLALLLRKGDVNAQVLDRVRAVMMKVLVAHPPPEGLPGLPRPFYQRSLSLKYCAQHLYEELEPKIRGELWARSQNLGEKVLLVAEDGIFRAPGGSWLELGKKKTLHRILDALVEHHLDPETDGLLTLEVCLELGWAGEKMAYEAATNRLYQVVSRLRRGGLKGFLLGKNTKGYRLHPDLQVLKVPRFLP